MFVNSDFEVLMSNLHLVKQQQQQQLIFFKRQHALKALVKSFLWAVNPYSGSRVRCATPRKHGILQSQKILDVKWWSRVRSWKGAPHGGEALVSYYLSFVYLGHKGEEEDQEKVLLFVRKTLQTCFVVISRSDFHWRLQTQRLPR